MIRKISAISVLIFANLVGLFVTLIGPWPTYSPGSVEKTSCYQRAITAIDSQAIDSTFSDAPDRLRAGWAKASMTPPSGVPLSGYGARKGAPSSGVHDELWVKALALNDGADTAVIVGSDMLIVPENAADLVRGQVWRQKGIGPGQVLLNASHTHSGPGAFGPGFLAKQFAGEFDPDVVVFLADAFTKAIIEAVQSMEYAAVAHGSAELKDYIRNRARSADTDDVLNYLVVQQQDGDRCYVVRYSAHATVLGDENLEFSGDYPGFLQRAIEGKTGGFAIFLGGAVGSMGPKPPDGPDDFGRARAMGEALAEPVLQAADGLEFQDRVEVASIGIPFKLPPLQFRLNNSWRLSPLLFWLVGLDSDGWFHGVRVGDVVLIGTPSDFSGEISSELRAWASTRLCDLWVLSFNGDYAGYISPDRYYASAQKKGMEGYEMFLMSWCGPNQEAFFTGLTRHTVEVLGAGPH